MNEEIAISTARRLLSENRLEESLAVLKAYWLQHPNDAEAANLLSELMKATGRNDVSLKLTKLSECMKGDNNDQGSPGIETPQELFEAGFSLIDERQHELAAMLLNRCVGLIPNEPVVNYELGFALMSLKRFEQAIPYFEYASTQSSDFDTCLNLVACYTMTRDLDKANKMLALIEKQKLANQPEQSLELNHRKLVLKRLESLSNRQTLSSRDWLYALYGAILLRTTEIKGQADAANIGTVLAILKGVLEGLRTELEAVEYYSLKSRPIAQALAEFLEIPVGSYQGPERPDRALLTIGWAGDIIGPHKSFLENQEQRHVFAFALPWDHPLPIAPDIVGAMSLNDPLSAQYELTTSTSGKEASAFHIEHTTKSILDQARNLESHPEIIQDVQEALDYYEAKRSFLLLANRKTFPYRCEYTAEIINQ